MPNSIPGTRLQPALHRVGFFHRDTMDSDTRPKWANAKVATSIETPRVNKNKLRELVETAALTDAQIVHLVMAESNRPCGIRTLQWWLSGDENRKPHRCWDWAIEALEKGLRKH
jgi:hypothetical protein